MNDINKETDAILDALAYNPVPSNTITPTDISPEEMRNMRDALHTAHAARKAAQARVEELSTRVQVLNAQVQRFEGLSRLHKMATGDMLAAEHYEYVNNYLTTEKFAEHRGLTFEQAVMLLMLARSCANDRAEAKR